MRYWCLAKNGIGRSVSVFRLTPRHHTSSSPPNIHPCIVQNKQLETTLELVGSGVVQGPDVVQVPKRTKAAQRRRFDSIIKDALCCSVPNTCCEQLDLFGLPHWKGPVADIIRTLQHQLHSCSVSNIVRSINWIIARNSCDTTTPSSFTKASPNFWNCPRLTTEFWVVVGRLISAETNAKFWFVHLPHKDFERPAFLKGKFNLISSLLYRGLLSSKSQANGFSFQPTDLTACYVHCNNFNHVEQSTRHSYWRCAGRP